MFRRPADLIETGTIIYAGQVGCQTETVSLRGDLCLLVSVVTGAG
ncbi:hypothetical protein [Acetobacter oeni]|nr:hypothetical protein [Acetobacter oeni]MBB3882414.1 hypothetical protein [Acetobacter oeni]